MSARFFIAGKCAGIMLLVCLAATPFSAASAGDAYLPLTGPAPLRFEAAMARTFVFSPAKPPAIKPTSDETPSGIETAPTPTNTTPEPAVTAAPEPDLNSSPASIGESLAPKPVAASPAAGDMLVITPQMLAEFFKPVPGATNAAGVSVYLPVPFSFTPPTERNPASSRATYKTE